MNKEEFIDKLQLVYFGDRNAFNEIVEDNQKLKNEVIYAKTEINRLNNIIDEFEDWLEKQRIRNSEWDNFVIKDTRLGIPITYLLDKLKELKEE